MWRQALRTTSLHRLRSCPSCVSSLHSLRPATQSSLPSLPNRAHRHLSSPRPPPADPPSDPPSDEAASDEEFEDFTSILALDPAAAAAANAAALAPQDVIDTLSTSPRDMTPAQADALVLALVSAADASISAGAAARGAPPPLTAHTVRILRAARISTNFVLSGGGDGVYPIERKVIATLDLAELGCGRLERAAVEGICGARCKDGVVKVVGDRFGTREENVAWVVGVLGRIVKEARIAVGETVDDTVLGSWDEVVDVATKSVEGDTEMVRDMVQQVLKGDPERDELEHVG